MAKPTMTVTPKGKGPLDPTTRVKQSFIGPKGLITDTKSINELRAIVFTVYKGDEYKDGPPFETKAVMDRTIQLGQVFSWSWDEAEKAHEEMANQAYTRITAN